MANYSLVIDSKFKPFSFERYIQPYQIYGEAYKEQENILSELEAKANVWEGMIDPDKDSEANSMYQKYATALREVGAELATRGLSPGSRAAALRMRSRYASEITPIEQAYNKRLEDIRRQRDVSDKTGGRTVFTRDAASTSLDAYLKGALPEYGQANLDTIMNEGMVGAKSISSRYFSTKEGKAFNEDFFTLTKMQGLNPGEAMEVLRRTGKYPEFESFIQNELSKVGAVRGNSVYSDADRDRIESALMQGINAGIVYGEDVSMQQNWRAAENLAHSHAMARQKQAQAFQAAENEKLMAPRAILDSDGNPTGHYYDPKIGMMTDEAGRIIGGADGSVTKIGTRTGSLTPTQKKAEKLEEDLNRVGSVSDLKKLGYTPVFATARLGGSWYSREEGEDAPGVWGDYTRSNLVSKAGVLGGTFGGGNITYNPRNNAQVTIVSDFSRIPGYNATDPTKSTGAMGSIISKLRAMGVDLTEDIQIMRVPSQDTGRAGGGDDYIIFRNNSNM